MMAITLLAGETALIIMTDSFLQQPSASKQEPVKGSLLIHGEIGYAMRSQPPIAMHLPQLIE